MSLPRKKPERLAIPTNLTLPEKVKSDAVRYCEENNYKSLSELVTELLEREIAATPSFGPA